MFKIGDKVELKPNLQIGRKYYNNNFNFGDVFTYQMSDTWKNKEFATVENIVENGQYKLDIDGTYLYTDEMLQPLTDRLAKSEYVYNREVEKLVLHLKKKHYYNLIDKGLEDNLHLTNLKEFELLIKKYNSIF